MPDRGASPLPLVLCYLVGAGLPRDAFQFQSVPPGRNARA